MTVSEIPFVGVVYEDRKKTEACATSASSLVNFNLLPGLPSLPSLDNYIVMLFICFEEARKRYPKLGITSGSFHPRFTP